MKRQIAYFVLCSIMLAGLLIGITLADTNDVNTPPVDPNSIAARQSAIIARIKQLQADKLAFVYEVNSVMGATAAPMLAAAQGLITESQSIQTDFAKLCRDANIPQAQQDIVLGITANYCDTASMRHKQMVFQCLVFIIQMSKDVLTQ